METREKTITIDIHKKYHFPENIKEVRYKDKILVVAVDTARWLVLDNESQLLFFNALKTRTIEDAIGMFGESQDIKKVLIQIEAKNFDSLEFTPSINGQKSMHLYLTNGCNLRCPHCYMYAGEKLQGELMTEEVRSLLHNFAKYGGEKVAFSGGEIATRPDLEEVVLYADNLGFEVELLTNGTLWTEEKVNRITGHIKSVQISIDGFDEASNSIVRGKGNFEKALKAVELFWKAGIKTEISIVPYYDNSLEKNTQKYVLFAKKLVEKFQGLSVRFATELLDGRHVHLTAEQKRYYSEIVTRVYSDYYGEDMHDFPFIQQRKKGHILNNCMFGELAVAANGDVFPCSRVTSATSLGNIKSKPFEKILCAANKAEHLSEIKNLRPCNTCELMNICGGGCRIDYFPKLLKTDIEKLTPESIPPRICTFEDKSHYYDLMIRTNERIYQ